MDNTENTPNVLSLCTGYGGIEIGLERAIGKINVLAHVEVEAYAIANLVAKMETGQLVPAPVWTDLKTFPAHCFSGCVDILTGGYSCQPFSAAGQRKGADDPRLLWPWIREHIRIIKPGICFFENVEGHISLGLREILTDLVKLGYRVESDSGEPTWGLFSAAEVGAPHNRKRVFILAYRYCSWLCGGWSGEKDRAKLKWILGGAGKRNSVWGQAQGCGFTELGNAKSNNQRRSSIATMHLGGISVGGSGCDMADPGQQGLQRRCQLGEQETGRETAPIIRHDFAGCNFQQWPARPGEPQYPWEQPRVLAVPTSQGSQNGRDKEVNQTSKESKRQGCWAVANAPYQLQHGIWESGAPGRGEPANKSERQIKSGLGGAVNESACGLGSTTNGMDGLNRIDRLRLLGNGVVPATAEKAFFTLMNRIVNPQRDRKSIEIQMELFA